MASGITRLSTKGQIVLPLNIRNSKAWKPGMELTVEETAEGVLVKPVRRFPLSRVEDVAGCLHRKGVKARTLAEMKAGIADFIRERHESGRY